MEMECKSVNMIRTDKGLFVRRYKCGYADAKGL